MLHFQNIRHLLMTTVFATLSGVIGCRIGDSADANRSSENGTPTTDVPNSPANAKCADGMRHVEGDYCFEIKHECLRSAPTKKSSTKNSVPDETCIEYWPLNAQCEQLPRSLSFHLLERDVAPTDANDAESDSPIARALIGKKFGETTMGCIVNKVNGSTDIRATLGHTVDLMCESTMHLNFCVDAYEYPNRPGELPTRYASWTEAQALCELAGKRLCYEHEWTLACEGTETKPYPYGWQNNNATCNTSRCVTECKGPRRKIQDNGLCRISAGARNAYTEIPLCPTPAQWLVDGENTVIPSQVEVELDRLDNATGVPGTTFRSPSGSHQQCVSTFGVFDLTGNVSEWTQCFDNCGESPASLKGGSYVSNTRHRCRATNTSGDTKSRSYDTGFRCCSSSK
jgi:hypothetical protein